MSIQEQKITEAAIAANGVQSRPDKLTGTAAQNKKVFDALVTAGFFSCHFVLFYFLQR